MTWPVDVLYVIPRPEIGGAERQLLMLLEGLDRNRFRPHVVCLDGDGSLYGDFARASESIHVIGRKRAFDLRALAQLVRIVRLVRPAVAHTWLHIANVYGGWAARLAGVAHVVASHRGLARDPRHGLLEECVKRTLNLFVSQFADRLVTNALAVANRMQQQGFRAQRTSVIHNGLRAQLPSRAAREAAAASIGLREGQVLLGTIARIDPKKDLETMLRAVDRVAREVPRLRLLVIGGGQPDYLRKLEALAQDLGIRDRVDFLGFRPDPLALMSLCAVSLLSSVTEGLPNAVLESMMLGRPVVATEVGGVPELITDGAEGFLVPPGDHGRLAARVLDLIRDPERAEKMGRQGQQRAAREFAPEAMLARTQALYQSLLVENAEDEAATGATSGPALATRGGGPSTGAGSQPPVAIATEKDHLEPAAAS